MVLHYDLVLSWNLLNVSLFKEIVVSMHAIELEFILVLSIRDYLSNTVSLFGMCILLRLLYKIPSRSSHNPVVLTSNSDLNSTNASCVFRSIDTSL